MNLIALLAATWLTGSPLATPRTEVAAAPLRHEIVVVGGFLASGGNSRQVDAYDTLRDRWRRLPDLPVSVDHAAAASAFGRVYVIGGYGSDRRPLRTAFVFDGRNWHRLRAPPEARGAGAAAIANGRLHLVGGRSVTGLARRMLVLDLRTLRWSTAPGPTPREHLAATALRGVVYAVGGRSAGYDTNVAGLEAFSRGSWRTLAPIPSARGGTGVAPLGGRLVSIGGEEPDGTIASVYAFDPTSGMWSRLPDLPTPRHGLGVVTIGGRVWAVAGGEKPGLTVSGTVESLGF